MQKKLFSQLKPYRFRILSGLLFCAFLISTWLMFHKKSEYPEEVHISLQEQLKSIIKDALMTQKPLARNLRFQKMWTQATNKKDQISAHFKYSYNDKDQVNLSVEGQALMNRKPLDPEQQHDLWSVAHIQINNTSLKFKDPITFLAGKTMDSPTVSPTEPADSAEPVEPAESADSAEPTDSGSGDFDDSVPPEQPSAPAGPSAPTDSNLTEEAPTPTPAEDSGAKEATAPVAPAPAEDSGAKEATAPVAPAPAEDSGAKEKPAPTSAKKDSGADEEVPAPTPAEETPAPTPPAEENTPTKTSQ